MTIVGSVSDETVLKTDEDQFMVEGGSQRSHFGPSARRGEKEVNGRRRMGPTRDMEDQASLLNLA